MSGKYIFTGKKHTYFGVMSTILGVIGIVAIIFAIRNTFLLGGVAPDRYASSIVLTLFFSFVGIILGLIGKNESERFHFFAYLGMILNILCMLGVSGILYAGAYGL